MLDIEAIDPRALDVLRRLMRSDLLRAFCLGGGTGLALQIGQRQFVPEHARVARVCLRQPPVRGLRGTRRRATLVAGSHASHHPHRR